MCSLAVTVSEVPVPATSEGKLSLSEARLCPGTGTPPLRPSSTRDPRVSPDLPAPARWRRAWGRSHAAGGSEREAGEGEVTPWRPGRPCSCFPALGLCPGHLPGPPSLLLWSGRKVWEGRLSRATADPAHFTEADTRPSVSQAGRWSVSSAARSEVTALPPSPEALLPRVSAVPFLSAVSSRTPDPRPVPASDVTLGMTSSHSPAPF